jgi:hypothetical protein
VAQGIGVIARVAKCPTVSAEAMPLLAAGSTFGERPEQVSTRPLFWDLSSQSGITWCVGALLSKPSITASTAKRHR